MQPGLGGAAFFFLVSTALNALAVAIGQRLVIPEQKRRPIGSVLALSAIGGAITALTIALLPAAGALGPVAAVAVWVAVIRTWYGVGWGRAAAVGLISVLINGLVLGAIVAVIVAAILGRVLGEVLGRALGGALGGG